MSSSKETEQFGIRLGRKLQGGEVIELVSDLGGGKTTLVRGIAHGAGSRDVVSSPTFTLSKVYKAGNFDIHHLDFYRLPEAGLMEHELADVLNDPRAVVIVEWGKALHHILPGNRLKIHMAKTGDNTRELECICPPELEYLLETA